MDITFYRGLFRSTCASLCLAIILCKLDVRSRSSIYHRCGVQCLANEETGRNIDWCVDTESAEERKEGNENCQEEEEKEDCAAPLIDTFYIPCERVKSVYLFTTIQVGMDGCAVCCSGSRGI